MAVCPGILCSSAIGLPRTELIDENLWPPHSAPSIDEAQALGFGDEAGERLLVGHQCVGGLVLGRVEASLDWNVDRGQRR